MPEVQLVVSISGLARFSLYARGILARYPIGAYGYIPIY